VYNVFKSETKWVEVILKDNSGTVINPTLETIHDIEIIFTSKLDFSLIAKFSKLVKDGWSEMILDTEKILCGVSDFTHSTKGPVDWQINIITTDENMPSGYSVTTQKGIVLTLQEAFV